MESKKKQKNIKQISICKFNINMKHKNCVSQSTHTYILHTYILHTTYNNSIQLYKV